MPRGALDSHTVAPTLGPAVAADPRDAFLLSPTTTSSRTLAPPSPLATFDPPRTNKAEGQTRAARWSRGRLPRRGESLPASLPAAPSAPLGSALGFFFRLPFFSGVPFSDTLKKKNITTWKSWADNSSSRLHLIAEEATPDEESGEFAGTLVTNVESIRQMPLEIVAADARVKRARSDAIDASRERDYKKARLKKSKTALQQALNRKRKAEDEKRAADAVVHEANKRVHEAKKRVHEAKNHESTKQKRVHEAKNHESTKHEAKKHEAKNKADWKLQ